mmetsp:Transcript_18868/g.40627  ORF Transcript_18868/g.40627 Transcript_18868/m.40627 type:complete len:504 (+) Transcript_18868:214-1725(+)|eukprot:CAMPEP_0202906470 /NCGR_PEP_ID=MMETSP1392-20130828/39049_1 /ASSEMBLY_ACC=CAM_ASM_000868 /TAXON_ID=225041 /ORGANISM="Chlamydomonas chlamydogama, Strain SAG 11-48b" /LENGTH=503 /DNA_ID=CAMNT_0049595001 /DNA_START=155 /DNA_END=1666 /DNA_ORIENTATION=+
MSKQDHAQQESLHGETAARRQAITELLFFASVGDLYRCKKITTAWALPLKDPLTADYDKRTPLHLAAAEGCYSVAAWLLAQGVDVNPVDRFKRTPLEDAVRGDHGEVATLLIQHGAKVLNKDGELVDLADSPLAGNVRIFTDYDPEWEIDPTSLTLLEKIGEGEFGIVHKARWHGTVVAVKILKEAGAVAIGDFRTELNVLQKVHHPHTVQFLGAVTKRQPFMIVTEFMTGGSLSDIFRGGRFPGMWRAVQLALDCARGLAYLHNRSPQAVIHRDLKPANIMLGGPKIYNSYHKHLLQDETGVLKIADFGLSKSLKLAKRQKHFRQSMDASIASVDSGGKGGNYSAHNDASNHLQVQGKSPSYKLTGETGSYRYMAPEVFRHEQYNNKVDVYGFAMIAYQLFEGNPPFAQLDPVEAARSAALHHKRPEWGKMNRHNEVVPPKLKALVESCWASDYESRPEFDDIVDQLEAIARDIKPKITEGNEKSVVPGGAGGSGDGCCTVQ